MRSERSFEGGSALLEEIVRRAAEELRLREQAIDNVMNRARKARVLSKQAILHVHGEAIMEAREKLAEAGGLLREMKGLIGEHAEIGRFDEISAAQERSGYDKLAADCGRPALRKTRGDMYVDLSGYAKGYAVDALAELLDGHGFKDYLVEIGGEIRVRGQNAAGADWAIAIEKPQAGSRSVQTIVRLTDVALATSGDYRNFFEVDGRRYSHTIDPATGRPVEHNAASVTVIDPSTARADGLATALLVMGPEDGLAFAEQNELAAYYLVRTEERFEDRMSTRFTGLLH